MVLANCDIWSIVDFGNGPVEIRCTEVGYHDQHRCEVYIEVEPEVVTPPTDVTHRDIFEGRRVS